MPFNQTCDIDNLDCSWYYALGVVDLGELHKTLIGHSDNAHVGLNGAEGEVSSLGTRIRQAVKEC